MINQDFTVKNFQYLLRKSDLIFAEQRNIKNIVPILEDLETSIRNNSFSFDKFETGIIRGNRFYTSNTFKNRIALKKINNNVARIYKVKPSSRTSIIKNAITLLSEECPFYIIKTDIKSFYESINLNDSVQHVLNNGLLSLQTKSLLTKLLKETILEKSLSLPRGVNISSTLSEIHMRNFDLSIKGVSGVYYYGRFVDDIIVLCFKNPKYVLRMIKKVLNEKGMKINNKKTKIMGYGFTDDGNIDFDFLGYKFIKSDKLEILISKKKINKIKTRIVRSLLDYKFTNNASLLIDRIKYLSSNYIVDESISGALKSGIFYNYPLAHNCEEQLDELDKFLRMNVYSKNGLVCNEKIPITDFIRNHLKKYSFLRGYENKLTHKFSNNRIADIKRCWQYA